MCTLPDLFQSFAKIGGVPRLRHFGFSSRFWRGAVHYREHQTLLPFIPTWLNATYCCQCCPSSSLSLFPCWLLATTSLHSCLLCLVSSFKDPCQESNFSFSYITLFFHYQSHPLFHFWLLISTCFIYLPLVTFFLLFWFLSLWSSVLSWTVPILAGFQGLLSLLSSPSCRVLGFMLFFPLTLVSL